MGNKKKELRRAFRTAVFQRDKYTCRGCGFKTTPEKAEEELDAHHIVDRNEMPSGGYIPQNGISLCEHCHVKAEVFHSSKGKDFVKGFHPDDLYKLIGSSRHEAVRLSKKYLG